MFTCKWIASSRRPVSHGYSRENSCSGRYPACSMSSFHFAGSLIFWIAVPGLPASICTLFLAGRCCLQVAELRVLLLKISGTHRPSLLSAE